MWLLHLYTIKLSKIKIFIYNVCTCFNQISIKLCSLTSIVDFFSPEVSTADNCFIRPPLLPTVYILCMYNIKLTCLCENSCNRGGGVVLDDPVDNGGILRSVLRILHHKFNKPESSKDSYTYLILYWYMKFRKQKFNWLYQYH